MNTNLLRLCITALMMLVTTATYAYDALIDGIYYNFNESEATVTYLKYQYSTLEALRSEHYTGAVVIPATVDFYGQTFTVTAIGDNAFEGCYRLTSVKIPNTVTKIGKRAFFDCIKLNSLDIPNSVTKIDFWAFNGCVSLTSITIPESVIEIGLEAFQYCEGVKELIYAEGCKTALDTGLNYARKVTIPSSVTSIAPNAFGNFKKLTSISIPASVTSIGSNAFYGCSALDAIAIPSSVTFIDSGAFFNCSSLVSIAIPSSVTKILDMTFYDCTSLASVSIPNSVTMIAECAFIGCSALSSVSIPASVTSIGRRAFYGCSSLRDVYSLGATPPKCDHDTFEGAYNALLHVPIGAEEAYSSAVGWRKFYNITEDVLLSIASPSSVPAPTGVYSLHGTAVGHEAGAMWAKGLPEGIYLVNGRKVLKQ